MRDCKDLWQVVFRKQIDNLKTNHRGTFVLTDNKFMALGRMSVDRGRGPRGTEEALGAAQPVCFVLFSVFCLFAFLSCEMGRQARHTTSLFPSPAVFPSNLPPKTPKLIPESQFLYFPCGIIRGALSAFGLNVTVHAETSELPQAIFQIRTVGSKP